MEAKKMRVIKKCAMKIKKNDNYFGDVIFYF